MGWFGKKNNNKNSLWNGENFIESLVRQMSSMGIYMACIFKNILHNYMRGFY